MFTKTSGYVYFQYNDRHPLSTNGYMFGQNITVNTLIQQMDNSILLQNIVISVAITVSAKEFM